MKNKASSSPSSPSAAYSRRAFMLVGGGFLLNSCASSDPGDDLAMDGPVFGEGQKAVKFTARSATGQFDLAQLKIVARTVAKGRALNANEQVQVVKIARRVYEQLVQQEVTALVREEAAAPLPAPAFEPEPAPLPIEESVKASAPRKAQNKPAKKIAVSKPKPKTPPAERRKAAEKRVEAKNIKGIAVPIEKKEVAFASVKDGEVKAEESSYKVDNDLPDKGSSVAFASVKEKSSDNVAAQYTLEKEGPQVAAVEHEGENYALATP